MAIGVELYNQLDTSSSIEHADAHRLIQMLMEGVLDRLGKAKVCIINNQIEGKGKYLGNCCEIVAALQDCLDQDQGGDIAKNLYDLYAYMLERLVHANLNNEVEAIDEVVGLISEIKSGWDGIEEAGATG